MAARAPAGGLAFEPNRGQAGRDVRYLARLPDATLLLTRRGPVFRFANRRAPLKMRLLGAEHSLTMSGGRRLPGVMNIYEGRAPSRWRSDLPRYADVRYARAYPGIDLVVHSAPAGPEYDFELTAGADARAIRLRFTGARRPFVARDGSLVLRIGRHELRQPPPRATQPLAGGARRVPVRWRVNGNVASFTLGHHDRRKPLVIDPVFIYGALVGGEDDEVARGMTSDGAGNTYLTGYVRSAAALTSTPNDDSHVGSTDAFVTKLDPAGQVVYSTLLGGKEHDRSHGVAVDTAGQVYVGGHTNSRDFPTLHAFQRRNHGDRDAFVSKLDGSGKLTYSTYLGGAGFDINVGIAVDGAGDAYLTGHTTSDDFPLAGALQEETNGSDEIFVTELNPSGSQLVYSTYLGGSRIDEGGDIAVDATGAAYIAGHTDSRDLPTVNALRPRFGGGNYDGIALKIAPGGRSLDYSTYLGGAGTDFSTGLAVDSAGAAYIGGDSSSADFPTAAARQPTLGGHRDATLTKLAANGSAVYSTFLGGSGTDIVHGVAIDSAGDMFLAGNTKSHDLPTANPLQPGYAGATDAFVAEVDATGNQLLYSSYIGGSRADGAHSIAVGAGNNTYVAGTTMSHDFPLAGASGSVRSGADPFLLAFDMGAPTPPQPPPPPTPPPPTLLLGAPRRAHAIETGSISLPAICDSAAVIVASGTLRVHGMAEPLDLERAVRHAAPGHRVTLELKLPPETFRIAKKADAKHWRMIAIVRVFARTGTGSSPTKRRAIEIAPTRAHRPPPSPMPPRSARPKNLGTSGFIARP